MHIFLVWTEVPPPYHKLGKTRLTSTYWFISHYHIFRVWLSIPKNGCFVIFIFKTITLNLHICWIRIKDKLQNSVICFVHNQHEPPGKEVDPKMATTVNLLLQKLGNLQSLFLYVMSCWFFVLLLHQGTLCDDAIGSFRGGGGGGRGKRMRWLDQLIDQLIRQGVCWFAAPATPVDGCLPHRRRLPTPPPPPPPPTTTTTTTTTTSHFHATRPRSRRRQPSIASSSSHLPLPLPKRRLALSLLSSHFRWPTG